MAKVTGIGGVFFKAKDPDRLARWYAEHLGVDVQDWGGAIFEWSKGGAAEPDGGQTVWHVAAGDAEGFLPSNARWMINYRVDDLAELLAQLAAAGIEPVAGPDDQPTGRFAWIMDPEHNKVELWEPRAED